MSSLVPIQSAGKIDIQALTLIAGDSNVVDLQSYLVELNLFEDIYSGGMYGNVVLSDSIGLVHRLSMVGEEYITIKIDTPSFNTPIWKTFRCCGISERRFTKDTTTEAYVVHFVSPEVVMDHYNVVQQAFDGNADDIVEYIYRTFLSHPRNLIVKDGVVADSEDFTQLCIYTECKTPVKFVSPSWSPMKCLSWLASKVVSSDATLSSANFLFFESNKQFYWGSLEKILKDQREKQNIFGIYTYAPANVKSKEDKVDVITVGETTYKNPDLTRDFFSIIDLKILKNVDYLENLQTGYLSSVYHNLSLMDKSYTETTYDHVTRYPYYEHTQSDAYGFFAMDTIRSPYAHQMVGFSHKGLYTGVENNLNERAKDIQPIRNSVMAEMNQIKMQIDVHGRSDAELGSMIYVIYPKSGPKEEGDKNKGIKDPYYSGLYLITSIHHQITLENHKMTMEVIKDSFGDVNEGKGAT